MSHRKDAETTATRREVLQGLAGAAALTAAPADPPQKQKDGISFEEAGGFSSQWPENVTRVWIGPEYWANRLQDWRIAQGRLECMQAGAGWPMRTVHLLTRRLMVRTAHDSAVDVTLGRIEPAGSVSGEAAAGFLIGAGGPTMDYRAASLIHQTPGPGGGLFCGVDAAGKPFFRDFTAPLPAPRPQEVLEGPLPPEIRLMLHVRVGAQGFNLTLTAVDPRSGDKLGEVERKNVAPESLAGNIALVSHPGSGSRTARFWFRNWMVGAMSERYPERAWGPILSTLYTVHDGVLKLTAQLAPIGPQDTPTAQLHLKQNGKWRLASTTRILTPGFTAPFRGENWKATEDVPFRVTYELRGTGGKTTRHTWEGTIRKDPTDKDTLVVANLSCVQQINGNLGGGQGGPRQGGMGGAYRWADRVWFPHHDMVPNLAKHKADLYFFAGDQIYEGNPTRPIRQPEEESELDYLYKWYLWCWSFGDLVRHTPTICIPDDHDVYQGNVWGDQGKPSAAGDPNGQQGGYGMPPRWLNMMQRTQTSHLPDPHDPAPIGQGIGVYYTALTWGGIGFAILEDRKFKSSPSIVKVEKTPDNHITEKGFDTRKADLPGATLLGDRQLEFIRKWVRDWRGHSMKAALSQTIFCNLQISSRPPTTGELDRDLDSNGWPQSGRRAALRELRKGFAIHLAGDQHLASTIHHGVDEWEDGPFSLCSPAISNLYIRFWNPDYPPADGPNLRGAYTGRYEDGFHNKITVHAIANPVEDPKPGQFPEPMELHRKAPGYSIVRFDKRARTMTLEVWPRYVDPADPKTGSQYPGWPITVRQEDNYRRRPAAWLPTVRVRGAKDPVLQVIDDASGELVYAVRIRGTEFRPPVFSRGRHSVTVSENGKARTLSGLEPVETAGSSAVDADLR